MPPRAIPRDKVAEAREWVKLFYGVLAGLCMLGGVVVASYLVFNKDMDWLAAAPMVGTLFSVSLIFFLVSGFLTIKDVQALHKSGLIPGVRK